MNFKTIHEEFPTISQSEREQLIAYILNTTREHVIARGDSLSFSTKQYKKLRELLHKRFDGVPLAYLTNRKEFFGLEFFVNEHTLIPRPETEILVERVLTIQHKWQVESPLLIEIGTGSGAIAVSIAVHIPRATLIATDISSEALKIAKKNAHVHGVFHRINFVCSNILSNVSLMDSTSELLFFLANLPYVPDTLYETANNHTDTQGIRYEPRIALTAGKDGLDAYRNLFEQLKQKQAFLPKKIIVICEFLGDEIQTAFFTSTVPTYFPHSEILIHTDLSGKNRFAEIIMRNYTNEKIQTI